MSLVVVTGGERRVSSGQPRPMRQSRPGPRVLILPTFDPPVSTSQQTLQATLLQNVFMNPVTYLLGL